MGSQRVGLDWVIELNWTNVQKYKKFCDYINIKYFKNTLFKFYCIFWNIYEKTAVSYTTLIQRLLLALIIQFRENITQ